MSLFYKLAIKAALNRDKDEEEIVEDIIEQEEQEESSEDSYEEENEDEEEEAKNDQDMFVEAKAPAYRAVEGGTGFQFQNPDGSWGAVIKPTAVPEGKKSAARAVLAIKDDGELVSNAVDSLNLKNVPITAINPTNLEIDFSEIGYDNTASGLESSTVQTAIDEVAASISGLGNGDYQESVLAIADNTQAPPTQNEGDRYLLDDTAGSVNAGWDGASANDIVEYDGTEWKRVTPTAGTKTYIEDIQRIYYFDGTNWLVVSEFLRDASTTEKGIASFDEDFFTVTNGNVTFSGEIDSARAANYYVGPNGDFTTISAAISEAIADSVGAFNPKIIDVAAGFYPENVAIPSGVHLICSSSYAATILGQITFTGTGLRFLTNMSVSNGSGHCINITGSNAFHAIWQNGSIDLSAGNFAGLFCSNANARFDGSRLIFTNTNGSGKCVEITAGETNLDNTFFLRPKNSTALELSGGVHSHSNVFVQGKYNLTGDARVNIFSSNIDNFTGDCITTTSSSLCILGNSTLKKDTSVGFAVAGSGVFLTQIVSFTGDNRRYDPDLNGGFGAYPPAFIRVDIAKNAIYDNENSGLSSTTIQAAIDEVAANSQKFVIEDSDVNTAWGTASSGFYTRTILASTHGKGVDPLVYGYDFTGGSVVRSLLFDRIEINSSGDITIFAPESPDGRIQAKIVVL